MINLNKLFWFLFSLPSDWGEHKNCGRFCTAEDICRIPWNVVCFRILHNEIFKFQQQHNTIKCEPSFFILSFHTQSHTLITQKKSSKSGKCFAPQLYSFSRLMSSMRKSVLELKWKNIIRIKYKRHINQIDSPK